MTHIPQLRGSLKAIEPRRSVYHFLRKTACRMPLQLVDSGLGLVHLARSSLLDSLELLRSMYSPDIFCPSPTLDLVLILIQFQYHPFSAHERRGGAEVLDRSISESNCCFFPLQAHSGARSTQAAGVVDYWLPPSPARQKVGTIDDPYTQIPIALQSLQLGSPVAMSGRSCTSAVNNGSSAVKHRF